MFITNTINKQTFDFTCASELVATRVQNEMIYHTGSSLNNIIDEVFTESSSDIELLIIDKLEIDLAETTVNDFGNRAMLDAFKQTLQAKIASLVNVPPRVQNEHLLSVADAHLDATIAFLSTGYFPWWVDRTAEINCDEMLQSAARERPQALQNFLIENSNESKVVARLQQQYKTSTKAAIDTLVPGLLKYNKKTILDNWEPEIRLDELPAEMLDKLKYIAEKPGRLAKEYKVLTLLNLLREPHNKGINKVKSLSILSAEELHKLELFGSSENKNKTVKKEVIRILNKLSIFQLEFLLQELSRTFDEKTAKLTAEIVEAKKLRGSSIIDRETSSSVHASSAANEEETLAETTNNGVDLTNYSTKIATNNNTEIYNESIEATQTRLPKNSIDQAAENKQPAPSNSSNALKDEKKPEDLSVEIAGYSDKTGSDSEALILRNESTLRSDNTTTNPSRANPPIVIEKRKESISDNVQNVSDIIDNSINSGENQHYDNKLHSTKTSKSELAELGGKKEDENGPIDEVKLSGMQNDTNAESDNSVANSSVTKLSATKSPATSHLKDESAKDEASEDVGGSYPDSTKTNNEKFTNDKANPVKKFKNETLQEERPVASANSDTTKNEAEELYVSESKIITENSSVKEPRLINEESKKHPVTVTTDDEVERGLRVDYIQNKIGRSNKVLTEKLYVLTDQDLLILEEQFRQFERLDNRNEKLGYLIQHPYFFKYDLLKILVAKYVLEERRPSEAIKSTSKRQLKKSDLSVLFDTIISAQAAFDRVLENLSTVEAIVLRDIIEKKAFETENEKKIIKKILKKLPDQPINLLYFFTQLPESEMQKFFAASVRNISASNTTHDITSSFHNYVVDAGKIHIENAGLCIIATYFPALFGQLQYLENGIFKNKAIATRAIYLIQYITTGRPHSPEFLLAFNKLLCGFNLEEEINAHIRLTKKEKMEADDLLQSVIENWSTLKNTSLGGFRTSFLQRRGILTENEMSWTLQVERKSYDLLLSTISWGYGIIKLAWMKKHIQVEW